MDKELINIRYNHHEDKRKKYLELAIKQRNDLIAKPELFQSKNIEYIQGRDNDNNDNNNNNSSLILIGNGCSTAVQEEQKRLERLRNKNVKV